MKKYKETLKVLTRHGRAHGRQFAAIRVMSHALINDERVTFKVCFASYWPKLWSVSADDTTLHGAFEKAVDKWKATNFSQNKKPGTGQALAFVMRGRYILPLEPADAARIASSQKDVMYSASHFRIDERLVGPAQIVWSKNAELPGI